MLRTWNGHFYVNDAEVSEAEYNAALLEIREKCALERDVLTGAKTIEDVPADWQEEIAARVEQRREEMSQPEEIGMEEALDIILGGVT